MSSGAGDERACAGDPVLFVALFSSADVVPSTMSHRTPLTVKNKQAPAAQHFTGVLYSAPSLRLCTPENARSEALSSALVLLGTDSRGSKSSGSELISMACMLLARTVPIVRPRSARRAASDWASDGVRAAHGVSPTCTDYSWVASALRSQCGCPHDGMFLEFSRESSKRSPLSAFFLLCGGPRGSDVTGRHDWIAGLLHSSMLGARRRTTRRFSTSTRSGSLLLCSLRRPQRAATGVCVLPQEPPQTCVHHGRARLVGTDQ